MYILKQLFFEISVNSGFRNIYLAASFKVVPPSFEHGLVLLATLIRGGGGGGVTSTRLWRGHLCQNTVQCLKYFCNWL